MGFGDEIPKQGMGWQPHRPPHMREAQFIISQGAKRHLTDGWHTKAAFNRREAEMGFGDEIPKRGMGLRLGLTALRGASEGWGYGVSGSMRL